MSKKQIDNTPVNRISARLMNFHIAKHMMKDIEPEEKNQIFMQKVELMTYREDFNKNISKLRKKHKIPAKGFLSLGNCADWAGKMELVDEITYEDDFDAILKYFTIKKRWFSIIEYYLLFNKLDMPHLLPKSVFVEIKPDIDKELSVYIKIQPETTLKDIKSWWNVIKTYQGIAVGNKGVLDGLDPSTEYLDAFKDLPKDDKDIRRQHSKKEKKLSAIQKNKEAYDLKMKGNSTKEIKVIMNKNRSAKELLGEEDVRDCIRQFKNTVENNKLN